MISMNFGLIPLFPLKADDLLILLLGTHYQIFTYEIWSILSKDQYQYYFDFQIPPKTLEKLQFQNLLNPNIDQLTIDNQNNISAIMSISTYCCTVWDSEATTSWCLTACARCMSPTVPPGPPPTSACCWGSGRRSGHQALYACTANPRPYPWTPLVFLDHIFSLDKTMFIIYLIISYLLLQSGSLFLDHFLLRHSTSR